MGGNRALRVSRLIPLFRAHVICVLLLAILIHSTSGKNRNRNLLINSSFEESDEVNDDLTSWWNLTSRISMWAIERKKLNFRSVGADDPVRRSRKSSRSGVVSLALGPWNKTDKHKAYFVSQYWRTVINKNHGALRNDKNDAGVAGNDADNDADFDADVTVRDNVDGYDMKRTAELDKDCDTGIGAEAISYNDGNANNCNDAENDADDDNNDIIASPPVGRPLEVIFWTRGRQAELIKITVDISYEDHSYLFAELHKIDQSAATSVNKIVPAAKETAAHHDHEQVSDAPADDQFTRTCWLVPNYGSIRAFMISIVSEKQLESTVFIDDVTVRSVQFPLHDVTSCRTYTGSFPQRRQTIANFLSPATSWHAQASDHSSFDGPCRIALSTQLTKDRLTNLELAASIWKGPVSATLLLFNAGSSKEQLSSVVERYYKSLILQTYVTIHVVWEDETNMEDQRSYPVNYLRNIALSQTHPNTSHVFYLDVDITPGFSERQGCDWVREVEGSRSSPYPSVRDRGLTAFVAPAFNVDQSEIGKGLPGNKQELVKLVDTQQSGFKPLNVISHAVVNHKKWMTAEKPYEISYFEDMEPYFIVSVDAPLMSDIYAGYGRDKCAYSRDLHAAGYKFLVLPEAFVLNHLDPRGMQTRMIIRSGDLELRTFINIAFHRNDIQSGFFHYASQYKPTNHDEKFHSSVNQRVGCNGAANENAPLNLEANWLKQNNIGISGKKVKRLKREMEKMINTEGGGASYVNIETSNDSNERIDSEKCTSLASCGRPFDQVDYRGQVGCSDIDIAEVKRPLNPKNVETETKTDTNSNNIVPGVDKQQLQQPTIGSDVDISNDRQATTSYNHVSINNHDSIKCEEFFLELSLIPEMTSLKRVRQSLRLDLLIEDLMESFGLRTLIEVTNSPRVGGELRLLPNRFMIELMQPDTVIRLIAEAMKAASVHDGLYVTHHGIGSAARLLHGIMIGRDTRLIRHRLLITDMLAGNWALFEEFIRTSDGSDVIVVIIGQGEKGEDIAKYLARMQEGLCRSRESHEGQGRWALQRLGDQYLMLKSTSLVEAELDNVPALPECMRATLEYVDLMPEGSREEIAGSMTDIILFTKNRPLQTFAFVESLLDHVTGVRHLWIIAKSEAGVFDAGYALVESCLGGRAPFPITLVSDERRSDLGRHLVDILTNRSTAENIMFAVDEMIWLRPVNLNIISAILRACSPERLVREPLLSRESGKETKEQKGKSGDSSSKSGDRRIDTASDESQLPSGGKSPLPYDVTSTRDDDKDGKDEENDDDEWRLQNSLGTVQLRLGHNIRSRISADDKLRRFFRLPSFKNGDDSFNNSEIPSAGRAQTPGSTSIESSDLGSDLIAYYARRLPYDFGYLMNVDGVVARRHDVIADFSSTAERAAGTGKDSEANGGRSRVLGDASALRVCASPSCVEQQWIIRALYRRSRQWHVMYDSSRVVNNMALVAEEGGNVAERREGDVTTGSVAMATEMVERARKINVKDFREKYASAVGEVHTNLPVSFDSIDKTGCRPPS